MQAGYYSLIQPNAELRTRQSCTHLGRNDVKMLHCYMVNNNYWVTQKLPQIYTANHATVQIRIRRITVQICGNFWVTQ